MTERISLNLSEKIGKILHVSELEEISNEIETLLTSDVLSDLEYQQLIKLKNEQLRFILNFNLLPGYDFIGKKVKNNMSETLLKVDSGEMVLEEFEIIEQEAIQLNLARVKYIQDSFEQIIQADSDVIAVQTDNKNKDSNIVLIILKYLNRFLTYLKKT